MIMVEIVFFIALFILVGSLFIQSLDLQMLMSNGLISSGFLPRILSIFLILLIVFYLIDRFRHIKINNQGNKIDIKSVIKQVLLIVSLFISIFLVKIVGMILTVGIFLLITLVIIEEMSWLRSAIFSLCTTLCIYIIFVSWLGLVLPKGIFG